MDDPIEKAEVSGRKALQQDDCLVDSRVELGDIALHEQRDIFHTVVYVADDLVFTKNGAFPMALG